MGTCRSFSYTRRRLPRSRAHRDCGAGTYRPPRGRIHSRRKCIHDTVRTCGSQPAPRRANASPRWPSDGLVGREPKELVAVRQRYGEIESMSTDIDIPGLCNCTKVRRAARHITRFYDACLSESGVRVTQYAILGHLKHRGPKTMLELADLMTMDRATVGHNLRPLERDGLVTIEVSKTDRPARIVSVTSAGLKRTTLGRPGWDRAQAEFETHFGVQGVTAMRQMMDQVVSCDFGIE